MGGSAEVQVAGGNAGSPSAPTPCSYYVVVDAVIVLEGCYYAPCRLSKSQKNLEYSVWALSIFSMSLGKCVSWNNSLTKHPCLVSGVIARHEEPTRPGDLARGLEWQIQRDSLILQLLQQETDGKGSDSANG